MRCLARVFCFNINGVARAETPPGWTDFRFVNIFMLPYADIFPVYVLHVN